MISKRIDRTGKTSSFERLGHYVLEAKSADASILWTRTAEYVVDLHGAGEKVLWSRLTNCEAELPVLAIAEIEATQAQNTRSKADKTYHLVISFPEGETPTREQLEDIEDELCQALGYGDHQRISAVHQDTDNRHLHVAINKVHPHTLNVLEPYRDYYIRDKACRMLEHKHGLLMDNGMGQGQRLNRAGDLEAHRGEQSLLSWIQEHLAESLKQVQASGQGWQDLHALLAEHDLVIKPRGAGLVIATVDGQIGVKASAVDRRLSFKSLTDRFGDYQPPEPSQNEKTAQTAQKEKSYQRGPRERHPGASSLWSQYQMEKDTAYQQRMAALQTLKVEQAQGIQNLKERYREQRAMVKANPALGPKAKRDLYQKLSVAMKADLAEQKKQSAEARQGVQAQYPALDWGQWLVQKAEQGNSEALAVLRSRQSTRKRLAQALLTAENLEAAQHLILPHLKPFTRKNGDVTYRLKDGGRVDDTAQAVYVPEVTEASALLALSLAQERFMGKPLIVEGSTAFKVKVAEMAVIQGLNVQFADPEMEKTRERLVLSRQKAASDQQANGQRQEQSKVRDQAQNRDDRGR